MHIDINRRAANNLFRPQEAEAGPNTEKLQALRQRLQLRKRELRVSERQDRQEKRAGRASLS